MKFFYLWKKILRRNQMRNGRYHLIFQAGSLFPKILMLNFSIFLGLISQTQVFLFWNKDIGSATKNIKNCHNFRWKKSIWFLFFATKAISFWSMCVKDFTKLKNTALIFSKSSLMDFRKIGKETNCLSLRMEIPFIFAEIISLELNYKNDFTRWRTRDSLSHLS